MIRPCKAGGIAFLGGAALALLSGCVEVPATYSQPVTSGSAAMREYLNAEALAAVQQREWAYVEALREQSPVDTDEPDAAPVVPQHRRHRAGRADDGPVISENPPVTTPAPVAPPPVVVHVKPAPADPSCVGWWRVCHFL